MLFTCVDLEARDSVLATVVDQRPSAGLPAESPTPGGGGTCACNKEAGSRLGVMGGGGGIKPYVFGADFVVTGGRVSTPGMPNAGL